MKKILITLTLSLSLFGCVNQNNTATNTQKSEKQPTLPLEISTTISHLDIRFKGLTLKSSKYKIEEIMGKPDSIIEPKYECGAFSEDWVGIPFYQYFYDEMNFIIYEKKGEIENIEFIDSYSLDLGEVFINNQMTFDEICRLLKIELPSSNFLKNRIILYPKEELDENYILEFNNEKLYKFNRFDPC